jgi:hypothetical protein
MGVRAQGHAKGAREAKVGQLQVALAVDEQVLRLQVAVQHAVAVAVAHTEHQLQHELAHNLGAHAHALDRLAGPDGVGLAAAAGLDRLGLDELLQVQVQELEDEVQLVAVGVDDVQQADNVDVVHLLQKGDFADGGAGHAFVLGLETDLLEGDRLVVDEVRGAVDDAVGA